jgi:hypothetical protein
LIVSVKPGPPAIAKAGVVEVIVAARTIVNVVLFDVVAPDTTVTVAVPGDRNRVLGTEAVNCVALTNVVASGDPFHSTTAPLAKPLPFTCNVRVENG